MTTRGWVFDEDCDTGDTGEGSADDEAAEIQFEIRTRIVQGLVNRWNELHAQIEEKSFRDRDDDPYYDWLENLEPEEQALALREKKIRDGALVAELHEIESRLSQYGARMMRPYEHWNEDEKYMEYMERDRDDDY